MKFRNDTPAPHRPCGLRPKTDGIFVLAIEEHASFEQQLVPRNLVNPRYPRRDNQRSELTGVKLLFDDIEARLCGLFSIGAARIVRASACRRIAFRRSGTLGNLLFESRLRFMLWSLVARAKADQDSTRESKRIDLRRGPSAFVNSRQTIEMQSIRISLSINSQTRLRRPDSIGIEPFSTSAGEAAAAGCEAKAFVVTLVHRNLQLSASKLAARLIPEDSLTFNQPLFGRPRSYWRG